MLIDLSKLKNNRLDLSEYNGEVKVFGVYSGDRIVVSGHSGKTIRFENGQIISSHIEDALCFSGKSSDCNIIAKNFKLLNGGMTFWDQLSNVTVKGFQILFPHTGIRATGGWVNRMVSVIDNWIVGASHEGLYLGISKSTENKSERLIVTDNIIDTTGWDGIQVGNWKNAWVGNNKVIRSGLSERFGQWHGIAINPGAQVWLWDNEIVECDRTIIVNQAIAYLDEKPKGF